MKTIFLFGCLFLLTWLCAKAQNQDSVAIKKFYEENTIYWTGSTKYIKNYQYFPLRDLKKEIRLSPDAIHEYEQYRRNDRFLKTAFLASGAMLVSAILVKNRQVKLGLLTGSVITATIAIPISFKSSAHLGRAIWLHNRDVLLK